MAGGPSVVIGDFSEASIKAIKDAYLSEGFSISATCRDGLSLVESARLHTPDIVSIDLTLPKLSGLQAIESILRHGLEPVFVVITSVTSREQVMAAKEAGVSYYVLKPFSAGSLPILTSRLADKFLPELPRQG